MFRNTDEIPADGCECNEQTFCQIVNEIDPTQFQIKASNLVVNPDFDGTLDPWYSQLPIQVSIAVSNVTPGGDCDGSISLDATNYSAPLSYSLNGGTFVPVGGSSQEYGGLCEGCGFVTVRDSLGYEASVEYCLVENIVCGDYSLTTDFVDVETIELRNCLTTDFV
ncbi:MAG: hypothetical protein V4687_16125 [Bacteroidota bacterium]